MSIEAIAWVFKQEIKPASVKFVLVALADNSGDTGEAWPAVSTICRKTSLERKTVIGALDKLCSMNLIRDSGRRMGRTNQVKVYQLLHFSNDAENGTVPLLTVNSSENGTRNHKETVNNKAKPSSQEEIEAYAESIGLTKNDGALYWDKWLGNGYQNSGYTIKDWRATLRSIQKGGWAPSQKKNGTYQKAPAESSRNLGTQNAGRAKEYRRARGVIRLDDIT